MFGRQLLLGLHGKHDGLQFCDACDARDAAAMRTPATMMTDDWANDLEYGMISITATCANGFAAARKADEKMGEDDAGDDGERHG